MIPITKATKQSTAPAAIEKKKRDREKDRNRQNAKKKIPSDAKARFGRTFQSKLCELMMSDDPDAVSQLNAMHDQALAYYKEHDLTEMWLSDDEGFGSETRAPTSIRMHHDSKADTRLIGASRIKQASSEEKEKLKVRVTAPAAVVPPPPVPIITAAPSSAFELSDDSEEETAKKPAPISSHHSRSFKLCEVCSDGTGTTSNALLECEECGNSIHQKCNRPEVSVALARDPRFLFVCYQCKDKDTSKVDRGGNNGGSSTKSSASSSTKKDDRVFAQKPTSDISLSASWATFAAKKMKKPVTTPGYGSLANPTALPRSNPIAGPPSKNFPSFAKK